MRPISVCPSCGSKNIKKMRRKWAGVYKGQPYTVDSLEFYECPECQEKVYDREAMRKIEANSPAFAKVATRK